MLAGPMNSSPPARTICWGVFFVTLTLLLTLRWPVLFMPLYEDQSVGFGREADFLDQTNFDYYKLRYEEPHFMFGGTARSYMVSAIPTLLALLHRVAGSVETTLFVWHLTSFLLAAGSATLTTGILLRFLGTIDALLVTACLVSTPMFLVQADVAGMELPLVFFSLLTVRAILREQFLSAIAFGTIAFFIKASGLLPLGAALGVILLQFLLVDRRPRLRWAILAGMISLAGLLALLAWGDDTALFRATFHWPSAFRLPSAIFWCPDLALLLLLAVGLALTACYLRFVHPVQFDSFRSWAGTPAFMLALWAGLVLVGSIASMLNYIFIPRYYILPLVTLYLIIGCLLATWPILTRVGSAILLVILVANLFNHAGALYPAVARFAGRDLDYLTVFTTRSCGFTERSLEYIVDHRSSIDTVRQAANLSPKATIFAEMPYWIYLTSPFVGYVDKPPADVVRANQFKDVVREFRNRVLLTPPDHEILFIWSLKSSIRMPIPDKSVEIIRIDQLDSPLILYRVKRSELPKTSSELEEWFLDHSWEEAHALHRAIDRYDFLRRTHRIERATREFHFARWIFSNPPDPEIRRAVSSIVGDLESAREQSVQLGPTTWMLESRPDAVSSISLVKRNQTIGVVNRQVPGRRLDAVQLNGPREFLRAGQNVSIRFRLRATRPCGVAVRFVDPFQPDQPSTFERSIDATEDWQSFQFDYKPAQTQSDAMLRFDLGRSNVTFEIDQATLEVTK
jgi:hypothetical protein